MNILDIHTHANRADAIINAAPCDFHPEPGKFYSVGIHPYRVASAYPDEWNLLQQIAANSQVLAIGEAGIDKLINADIVLQQHVFELQAELSERIGKPLIIHSVRTSNELTNLKRRLHPSVAWVIHGFRGNQNIAMQLLAEGFYLSFGEKYQREALLSTPLERMFVETDESTADIRSLYQRMSADIGLQEGQFIEQIHRNIEKVFFRQ